jgi:hypothetical protein
MFAGYRRARLAKGRHILVNKPNIPPERLGCVDHDEPPHWLHEPRTLGEQSPRIFHGSNVHVCVSFCRQLPSKILVALKKPSKQGVSWWAHKGSNLGPLPCEGIPQNRADVTKRSNISPRVVKQITVAPLDALHNGMRAQHFSKLGWR